MTKHSNGIRSSFGYGERCASQKEPVNEWASECVKWKRPKLRPEPHVFQWLCQDAGFLRFLWLHWPYITHKFTKMCLQISFEQMISNVDYSTKITAAKSDSGSNGSSTSNKALNVLHVCVCVCVCCVCAQCDNVLSIHLFIQIILPLLLLLLLLLFELVVMVVMAMAILIWKLVSICNAYSMLSQKFTAILVTNNHPEMGNHLWLNFGHI